MSSDPVVAHLGDMSLLGRSGALWGFSGDQLNANLVVVRPGDRMPAHINEEADVLLIVQLGSGTVIIDGIEHPVKVDSVVLVPAGADREIIADQQLLYFSIHQSGSGVAITDRA